MPTGDESAFPIGPEHSIRKRTGDIVTVDWIVKRIPNGKFSIGDDMASVANEIFSIGNSGCSIRGEYAVICDF